MVAIHTQDAMESERLSFASSVRGERESDEPAMIARMQQALLES
jgi:hypothetical protein